MNGDLFLGADTGGTGLKFVLTDVDCRVLHRGEVPTDPHSVPETLRRLAVAAAAAVAGSASARAAGSDPLARLAGAGLACAGIVNLATGRLGRSPNLPGWEGADLAGEIRGAFGALPVALANDVNSALFGEYRAGAGRGCPNLVMIALGTGVGGGVLLDGKLLTGSHFGAAEIGHMVLDPDGPPCTCGSLGCLEAYAGSVGLLRRAREVAADPGSTPAFRGLAADRGVRLTPRDLSLLAGAGDRTALGLFGELGERLGQAVGNLLNLLDPDRVLIGGGLAQAGELILEPCRRQAARQVLAQEAVHTPIVPAELGPHAAAVGAAWLARESGPTG